MSLVTMNKMASPRSALPVYAGMRVIDRTSIRSRIFLVERVWALERSARSLLLRKERHANQIKSDHFVHQTLRCQVAMGKAKEAGKIGFAGGVTGAVDKASAQRL